LSRKRRSPRENNREQPAQNNSATREGGAVRNPISTPVRLLELHLANSHDLLAALLRNGARHRSFLRLHADRLVVLLVPSGIEVVDGVLVAVLHHDYRRASLGLLQVALGAGDRALEGNGFPFFLLFLGRGY